MTNQQARGIIDILKNKGILFEEGLGETEFGEIEAKFNIIFPNDLKLLLHIALPVSDGFVNWRQGLESESEAKNINAGLAWPLEGMIYDIKNNSFWFDQWGNKPEDADDQIKIATDYYLTYPKLIPIYLHRYIPNKPVQAGNPIFSVHQMDIIYYGFDLASFFAREFKFELPGYFEILTEPKVEIEFWSYWTVYS